MQVAKEKLDDDSADVLGDEKVFHGGLVLRENCIGAGDVESGW